MTLPMIALSVRQPWAWAIVHGPKDVENRSVTAVRKGGMRPMRIAIHASQGMTRDEYETAAEFMRGLGVQCPPPSALVRGAIIGAATVTRIVAKHDSPWFFGSRGLLLSEKESCEPIPCNGYLGFFEWSQSAGDLLAPLPWMLAWPQRSARRQVRVAAPSPLFGDAL